MNCPKCDFPVAQATAECPRCGIVFAKVSRAQTQEQAPVKQDAPAEPQKQPAPLYAVALLIALLAAAAWWLNTPSGKPLPAQAYVNTDKGFAVAPPGGWVMITPKNYLEILERYKERFPGDLRKLIETPGFEISYLKLDGDEPGYMPNFNIVVAPLQGSMPSLTDAEKDKAAKIISEEMVKKMDSYRLLSSRILQVDAIDALQIDGSASLTMIIEPSKPIISNTGVFGRQVTGHTEEVSETYEIRCLQTFVPGRGQGYIISCADEAASFQQTELVFKNIVDSFRVLKHPPRFSPVVMGSLNGGLIGAGLYLVWLLMGLIFKSRAE